MQLQEIIAQSELDMTLPQVKAFFLGVLFAQKPLSFQKALNELVAETPELEEELGPELKKLWDELSKNKITELQNLFPKHEDIKEFISEAKDQLDYFLTAMSLSGTNTDTIEDDDLLVTIEDLEDLVMDMDEYLSDSKATSDTGEEIKESLFEVWNYFVDEENT